MSSMICSTIRRGLRMKLKDKFYVLFIYTYSNPKHVFRLFILTYITTYAFVFDSMKPEGPLMVVVN